MPDIGYDKEMRARLNRLLTQSAPASSPLPALERLDRPKRLNDFSLGFLACSIMFTSVLAGVFLSRYAWALPQATQVPEVMAVAPVTPVHQMVPMHQLTPAP